MSTCEIQYVVFVIFNTVTVYCTKQETHLEVQGKAMDSKQKGKKSDGKAIEDGVNSSNQNNKGKSLNHVAFMLKDMELRSCFGVCLFICLRSLNQFGL